MKRRELTSEEKEDAARLEQAWKAYKASNKGATQEWLGKASGIGVQSAVGQYLRGIIPLNLEALFAFSKALQVNPRSISPRLTEGLDLIVATETESGQKGFSFFEIKRSPTDEREARAQIGQYMQVHVADDGDTDVMRIPYYEAKASCGNGVINFYSPPKGHLLKEPSFFAKYEVAPQDIIAIFADGNSNADFIVEGDIALFNRKKTEPRSGKLFLIDHPDGLRIKQLRRLVDGSWVMESRNPDKREYPDEIIQPSQAEALRIMGEFFYRQGG